jgi:hypothetical protein
MENTDTYTKNDWLLVLAVWMLLLIAFILVFILIPSAQVGALVSSILFLLLCGMMLSIVTIIGLFHRRSD